MSVTATQLEALGTLIAQTLCTAPGSPVKGPLQEVARTVTEALQANFREEAAIEREVETQVAALGAAARGMDPDKLREGLRARIAKKRGFAL